MFLDFFVYLCTIITIKTVISFLKHIHVYFYASLFIQGISMVSRSWIIW